MFRLKSVNANYDLRTKAKLMSCRDDQVYLGGTRNTTELTFDHAPELIDDDAIEKKHHSLALPYFVAFTAVSFFSCFHRFG